MAEDRDRGSWPDSRGPYQQSSRPSRQVQAPRAAQSSPSAYRSGGPAGNERLTAVTGTALLILLAVGCPAHDHGRRHGRADRAAAAGPAYAAAPSALAEAWTARRPSTWHQWLDPVHRGVPGDVPGTSILITGVEDPTRAHGPNNAHGPNKEHCSGVACCSGQK